MKIGVVADCHIGNHQLFKGKSEAGINERCKVALSALRAMYYMAAEEGLHRVYIAGDLFDTSAPSPQVLAAVMDIIGDARDGVGGNGNRAIETVLLKGNHDSNSPNPGDNALGPLRHVCTVHETYGIDRANNIVYLPFQPRPSEWLGDVLETLQPEPGAIVLSHFGIADASTPLYMQHGGVNESLLDSLCAEYKISAWLSGDWHSHKRFRLPSSPNTVCYQIGALIPTGFDNPGGDDLYGSLVMLGFDPSLDIEDRPPMWVERAVVPGPRFYYSPDEPGMSKLTYIKLRVDQAYREDSCAEAVAAGELGGYVLAPDTETSAAATGAKVADEFAAAEVSGIDEALETYVDKMPGLDAKTRAEVKETCRKYINGLQP